MTAVTFQPAFGYAQQAYKPATAPTARPIRQTAYAPTAEAQPQPAKRVSYFSSNALLALGNLIGLAPLVYTAPTHILQKMPQFVLKNPLALTIGAAAVSLLTMFLGQKSYEKKLAADPTVTAASLKHAPLKETLSFIAAMGTTFLPMFFQSKLGKWGTIATTAASTLAWYYNMKSGAEAQHLRHMR